MSVVAESESRAIRELTEAIRLTVEYVGTDTLPAIEGWSWYDAMCKYAPEDAERLKNPPALPIREDIPTSNGGDLA